MAARAPLVFATCAVLAAAAPARAGSFQREELIVDGEPRELYVYTPAQLAASPAPVVIAFHGYQSDASGMRWIAKVDKFADAAGFVVIYPNAVNKSWNAGRGSGSTNRATDDRAFAKALLESISSRPKLDASRIYAMGFSNGAQMVSTIVCELDTRLAGAAMVAHSLNIPGCDPRARVPIVLIQGRKDPFVPFEGGGKSELASHAFTVDFFRRVNEATSPPKRIVERESIVCTRSDDRAGREVVVECIGERDGHTWPGGVPFQPQVFGPTNSELQGTEFIFSFFSRHPEPAPLRGEASTAIASAAKLRSPPLGGEVAATQVEPCVTTERPRWGAEPATVNVKSSGAKKSRAKQQVAVKQPSRAKKQVAVKKGSAKKKGRAKQQVAVKQPSGAKQKVAVNKRSVKQVPRSTATKVVSGGAKPAGGTATKVVSGGAKPTGGMATKVVSGGAKPTGGTATKVVSGGAKPTGGTATKVVSGGAKPTGGTAPPGAVPGKVASGDARPPATAPKGGSAAPAKNAVSAKPAASAADEQRRKDAERWREQTITLPGGASRTYLEPRQGFAGALVLVLVFPDTAQPGTVAATLGLAQSSGKLAWVLLSPELTPAVDQIVASARARAGAALAVSVVGIGTGGQAAQQLYCERPDLISAVVMLGAAFTSPMCSPMPVPSLLSVQAARDPRAPADGDPQRGWVSQADVRATWKDAVAIPLEADVKSGAGYACRAERGPGGELELRTCRAEAAAIGTAGGAFNAARLAQDFLERHRSKPQPFTIVHAR
ncbi:MAG: PHB depolymerase family esterase [Kofleriaceae bacterium]